MSVGFTAKRLQDSAQEPVGLSTRREVLAAKLRHKIAQEPVGFSTSGFSGEAATQDSPGWRLGGTLGIRAKMRVALKERKMELGRNFYVSSFRSKTEERKIHTCKKPDVPFHPHAYCGLKATRKNVAAIRNVARIVPLKVPETLERPPRRLRWFTGISRMRARFFATSICISRFQP